MQHTYYLNGSQIIAEEFDGNLFIYIYDADGSPIGMQYRNTSYADGAFDVYWYEKNLQGDVVAIYDNSGNKLVEYEYNAWGLCDVVYYSSVTLPIFFNPFRYRGYYYDSESGLYYLNSRYYDPKTGRFLNADGYVSTGTGLLGYNMFAYCNNNPVNYYDPTGESVIALIALGAVGLGLLFVPSSESESNKNLRNESHEHAVQKYNSSTVNVYKEGEGEYDSTKFNIKFYGNGNAMNIQMDQYLDISNNYEVDAILNIIVSSEYYKKEIFGSRTYMKAQWIAHKICYDITMSGSSLSGAFAAIANSKDPVASAVILDIRGKANIGNKMNWAYWAIAISGVNIY